MSEARTKASEAIASLIPRLRSGVPQVEERWPGNDGFTKHYSIGIANSLMAEAADHLAALSALPPDREAVPVGYLFRLRYGPDHWSSQLMYSSSLPKEGDYKEVQPLYAHPSTGNADRSEGVRALDGWRHIPSLNVWSVATPLGVSYWAWERDGRGFWCRFENSNERIEVTGGLTGAQGAVQTDFRQRVRSCISPPQTEEGDKPDKEQPLFIAGYTAGLHDAKLERPPITQGDIDMAKQLAREAFYMRTLPGELGPLEAALAKMVECLKP